MRKNTISKRKIVVGLRKKQAKVLVLKEKDEKIDVFVDMKAELDFLIIAHFKKSQSCNLNIKVFHKNHSGKSRIKMHVVAEDSAEVTLTGEAIVAKGAKNVSVELSQLGILLSNNASINLQPFLDISDNRIIGKHSAIISSPSKEQKYYLQTRGIKKSDATALFVKELLHIPSKYTKI